MGLRTGARLAAADLGLLGVSRRSLWSRVDPRKGLRRLAASWRVGRLRVALPALAADVIARLDAELVAVPHPRGLTDDRLLTLLQASRRALVALHGHEVLAGLLVPKRAASSSAAARALEMLATGRQAGLDDDAIVAATPETLALIPPRIGARPVFAPSVTPPVVAAGPAHPLAETREALRLRARWVQELSARVALELGRRLAAKGALPDAGAVRLARLRDLGAILAGDVLTLGTQLPAPPPLPAAFRLTPDGTVIAVGARSGDGTGVSAGRAAGTVRGRDDTTRGGVLVVRTLDPSLAPLLPELDGLVAETGSVLSHLAILARELRLPAVIGVAGAMERFPAGTHIRIDGATGEVRRTEEAA